MHFNKSFVIIGALCAVILGLGSSGLHPLSSNAGYTGSPVDSNCAQCHTGNNSNLNGEITIDGLPSTIITGETYTISVTITNPNGNAQRAGFQLVALNGNNANAGTMAMASPSTQIRVAGGRNYFGHAPASNFPSANELNFTVDWTAPSTPGSNPVIKFYAATVIANGADGNSNDRVRLTNMIIPITSGATPIDVSITDVSPTLCADSSDGTATASVTGGTTPYLYLWNNGVTTATNTTLPSGLASVTVTDNTGATSSASTNISAPPAIIANASGSVVCDGASNGVASVLAFGGVGGFTYSWSTGQNGSSISGLTEGIYTVTVTDANGCQESSSAEVTVSPTISISGIENNISCFGESNGSISTSIFGGTPGYSYNWSNGSTQANISNLSANTYTLTVTDMAGCTASETFSISQPTVLSSSIGNISHASCYGANDGTAQILASGGTTPYTFNWSNGASGSGNTNTQNNLIAGTYFVTVTDFFDCISIQEIEINQPDQITIFGEVNDVSCNGLNDGSISLVVSNAIGSPTFQWSNGDSESSINNLSPGTYIVTVIDANECFETQNFVISEPEILTVNPLIVENVSCAGGNDGLISLEVIGGNGTNTYNWSNGSTFPTVDNAQADTYFVTVTDSKGCSATTSVVITEPESIQISVIETINATCLGAANGSINVEATNGINPYTYTWSNGATSAQLSNVIAGNYIVTVSDGNNCATIDTFTIGTNASFNISLLSSTDITCFGDSTGTASVLEVPTYTYLWSTGQTTAMVNNLPAGNHTVVATETGCQSTPLVVTISQPPLINANLTAADTILCLGDTNGFLSVTLNGGVGDLSYQWSHGDSLLLTDTLIAGVYSISVTDENLCIEVYHFEIYQSDTIHVIADIDSISCFGLSDGSIALNTSGGFGGLSFQWSKSSLQGDTLTNLLPGLYITTISDVGNCSIVDSFFVYQPNILEAHENVVDETTSGAKDGAITLIPTGGTAPFSVIWSNGGNTLTLTNLAPGIYNYQITDANDCTYASWVVVGGGDCNLSATYTVESSTCFNTPDGAINLNITGNFSEYDVVIYNKNEQLNQPLNALPSGTYTVIVSDSASCLTILSDVVIPSDFPAIVLDSLIITNPTSSSSTNGSIIAEVSGGEGTLSYEWTKFGPTISTSASISNQSAGIYQLKITDMAGCVLIINNIFLQAVSHSDDVLAAAIRTFPNPIHNDFSIQSDYIIDELEIMDVTGKIIHHSFPKSNEIKLNTDLVMMDEAGMFFCRIWIKNQSAIKKIVVIK
jgi:hypothetical protein